MPHHYIHVPDFAIYLQDHQNCSNVSREHRLDTTVLTPTNNRTKEQKKKMSRGDRKITSAFFHLQQLSSKVGEDTHGSGLWIFMKNTNI